MSRSLAYDRSMAGIAPLSGSASTSAGSGISGAQSANSAPAAPQKPAQTDGERAGPEPVGQSARAPDPLVRSRDRRRKDRLRRSLRSQVSSAHRPRIRSSFRPKTSSGQWPQPQPQRHAQPETKPPWLNCNRSRRRSSATYRVKRLPASAARRRSRSHAPKSTPFSSTSHRSALAAVRRAERDVDVALAGTRDVERMRLAVVGA